MSGSAAHTITSRQRMDMTLLGLSPSNPDHVRRYLKGDRTGPTIKEKEERIRAIMDDKLFVNLGHGRESDTDVYEGMSIDPMEPEIPAAQQRNQKPNEADVRKNMTRDMDNYAKSSGGLMNLRESNEIVDVRKPNNNNGAAKARELGTEMATEYYNAFIISLQKPSTKANLEVFKSIKVMLEQEKALQGSPNLQHFQEAVRQVTGDMYTQIKG